jgi:hypothetical protein
MTRVVPVVIPNRVPVMIGKYESDRRRNADSNVYPGLDDHATPVSATMAVDDTTGNEYCGEKQKSRQLTGQLQRELRFHWQSNISNRWVGFS